ncbi:MAG: L-threonine 3-dehydrogenase [Candidatus Eisenbacteria bacterium]
MASTMMALVKTEHAKGAELREVPKPKVGPNDVLIKVKASTVCGTDLHIYEWNEWAEERVGRRVPQTMGHEFSGIVEEVGSHVKRVKPGDFVSAETHIPCTKCVQCLTGQMHICSQLTILGVDTNGSFAEFISVPDLVVWKNDPKLPYHVAAAQEPLGNSVYTTLVEPVASRNVLIYGDGPTGLFATGVAKVSGAARIYLVGMSPMRLEIGRKMGADVLLNAADRKTEQLIMDETGGVGVDVVLDMVGRQSVLDEGLKLVRKGGRYSAFGLPDGRLSIDMNNGIIFKGLRLYGINGRVMYETWVQVSNLLASGRLDITPVITHLLPLERYREGFDLIGQVTPQAGKIAFVFPD